MNNAQTVFLGMAHVRPVDAERQEETRGAVGGYVQVTALADDAEVFAKRVRIALEDWAYELIDLDDVHTLNHAVQDGLLAPWLLELANKAAYENDTRFGTFHLYDDEGEDETEDEDDGPAVVIAVATRDRALVEVRRSPLPSEELEGFFTSSSDAWLLLHKTTDYILLDGHSAFPAGDVFAVELVDDDRRITRRVLDLRGESPRSLPEIDLTSPRRILETASPLYPLVTVMAEREIPDAAWIGRISGYEDDYFVLQLLTPGAEWSDDKVFAYDAVTRIDFGGRYEDALALAAGLV